MTTLHSEIPQSIQHSTLWFQLYQINHLKSFSIDPNDSLYTFITTLFNQAESNCVSNLRIYPLNKTLTLNLQKKGLYSFLYITKSDSQLQLKIGSHSHYLDANQFVIMDCPQFPIHIPISANPDSDSIHFLIVLISSRK